MLGYIKPLNGFKEFIQFVLTGATDKAKMKGIKDVFCYGES